MKTEWPNGTTVWCDDAGQLHRLDGPAFETRTGYRAWYAEGRRHNPDGPAVEREDGSREWWLQGVRVSESDVVQWRNSAIDKACHEGVDHDIHLLRPLRPKSRKKQD